MKRLSLLVIPIFMSLSCEGPYAEVEAVILAGTLTGPSGEALANRNVELDLSVSGDATFCSSGGADWDSDENYCIDPETSQYTLTRSVTVATDAKGKFQVQVRIADESANTIVEEFQYLSTISIEFNALADESSCDTYCSEMSDEECQSECLNEMSLQATIQIDPEAPGEIEMGSLGTVEIEELDAQLELSGEFGDRETDEIVTSVVFSGTMTFPNGVAVTEPIDADIYLEGTAYECQNFYSNDVTNGTCNTTVYTNSRGWTLSGSLQPDSSGFYADQASPVGNVSGESVFVEYIKPLTVLEVAISTPATDRLCSLYCEGDLDPVSCESNCLSIGTLEGQASIDLTDVTIPYQVDQEILSVDNVDVVLESR